MNTPMFDQPKDEITTLFTADGFLRVIVGKPLGHTQKKQWKLGIARINGIRWCGLDIDAPYASDQTVFAIAIHEEYSTRIQEVQHTVRSYTEKFLTNLSPEPTQPSLF